MDAKALKRLLPRNKDDAEGAKTLVALGFPTVEPVMGQMLDWLKTNGSPVELVMREFFAVLGTPGVPAVQKALASRHDALKYAIVEHVVSKWPAEAIAPLRGHLQSLATGSGYYGTDLTALRLLVEHRLAEPEWLTEWAKFKVKRLRDLLARAEHVESLLSR